MKTPERVREETGRLIFWNVFFAVALVAANVLAGKPVQLFGIDTHGAIVTYVFSFLSINVINEFFGRKEADRAVKLGLLIQIFASALILGGQYLPVASWASETQQAYKLLLGQNWRFVIASLIAYYISQSLNVALFRLFKSKTGEKKKWIRSSFPTLISQLVDTVIFITIAFLGRVPNIWIILLSQYGIKSSTTALSTLLFYVVTRRKLKGAGR